MLWVYEVFIPLVNILAGNSLCLEGFRLSPGSLPSIKDAVRLVLCLIYGDNTAELQSREKRQRNAEIYRRYLEGEDSVVLGRAFGLSDRRIRNIIDQERKRRGQ